MKTKPLWEKLYFIEVYWEAARVIGYAGCSPFEFWDRAKALKEKHGEAKVMGTVYDLSRWDKREASPPRTAVL